MQKKVSAFCPEVAAIMASSLGKDQNWIDKQVEDYTSLARKYILKQN